MAVVQVLTHSRTKDALLAACARNVWYTAAVYDIDLTYVHIMGKLNVVTDILSRWQNSVENIRLLHENIQDPLWIQVPNEMLIIDNNI